MSKLTIIEKFTPLLLDYADKMADNIEEQFRIVCYKLNVKDREKATIVRAIRDTSTPLGAGLRERRVYYFVHRSYHPSLRDHSNGHQCMGMFVKRPSKFQEDRTAAI